MFALHSFYDYESNNTESIGLDKKNKKKKKKIKNHSKQKKQIWNLNLC